MDTKHNHGKLKEMQEVKYLEKISGVKASDIIEIIEEGLESDTIEKIENQSLSHVNCDKIEFNQLRIFIQPIVSLKSGETIGAEALIRHNDKHITADKIIQNMIDTNRIAEFDLRVLSTVCKNKLWETLGVERININISGKSLEDSSLSDNIEKILREYSALKHVTIELNEETGFDSYIVVNNIEKLHKLGVELSLDDFNVSLSWISTVSKFNIKELKYRYTIKSRIDGVRTVAMLAKSLHNRLIVENIPDTYILDNLKEIGVEVVQSYLTGKPEYALDMI